MTWLVANWVWVLIGIVFIGMHLVGHGGHGGHGGSSDHQGHGGRTSTGSEPGSRTIDDANVTGTARTTSRDDRPNPGAHRH